MSPNLFRNVRNVMLATAIGAWAGGWGNTPVYAQHDHMQMGHQGMDHSGHQPAARQPGSAKQPVVAPPGPHGGRMTTMAPLTFEVVYQPQEIRVYVYGPGQQPQSARHAKGQIVIRVRSDSRTSRVALQYVAPPRGSSEQDYLAAAVDLSGVKDGDMTATFKLENLPLQRSAATFGQPVALSKAKVSVTLAALGPADQAGIARQRVCPVTGAALDSMGGPVKVLVGGQPLYLCCKGCLGKVQSDPVAYLQKANQASQRQ